MRQRNSYSRIIQDITDWEQAPKGEIIRLYHHCVEKNITSFMITGSNRQIPKTELPGIALSESGLSRDEIQLLGGMSRIPGDSDELVLQVENLLLKLDTDYLDLFFLDLNTPTEVIMPAIERLFSQGKIVETGVYDLHRPGSNFTPHKNTVKANISKWDFTPAAVKSLLLKEPFSEEIEEMLWIHISDPNNLKPLEHMAQKYSLSEQELLFAWLLHHEVPFHLVLGGRDKELINSASKALHTTLIQEDWQNLPKKL